MRVYDPPNLKLWLPFSQLKLSSRLKFGVLRASGPFALPDAAAVTRPASDSAYPPWLSNIAGTASTKKSTGDDCQPKIVSLTMLELIVDFNELDPVVRYEF